MNHFIQSHVKTFGAVHIGQAPRPDETVDMLAILGEGYRIVEAGALDGLDAAQIAHMKPQPGEDVLVTLANGIEVQVAERYITPLVKQKVNGLLVQGIPLVVLMCTGIPHFETRGKLVWSMELLNQAAVMLGRGRRVGVLTPTPEHIPQVTRNWGQLLGTTPVIQAVTPYHGVKGVQEAALKLKSAGVELVVMDCMAYTLEMQACVREIAGVPALLPRSLAARMVKELLG